MRHNNFTKAANIRTDVNRRMSAIEQMIRQTPSRVPIPAASTAIPNTLQPGTSGAISFTVSGQKIARIMACAKGGTGGADATISAVPSGFASYIWKGSGGASSGLFIADIDIAFLGVTSISTSISSGVMTITIVATSVPVLGSGTITVVIQPGGNASGITPGVVSSSFAVNFNSSPLADVPFPFIYQQGHNGQPSYISGLNPYVVTNTSAVGTMVAGMPISGLGIGVNPFVMQNGPGGVGYQFPDHWSGIGAGAGAGAAGAASANAGTAAWATLFTDT